MNYRLISLILGIIVAVTIIATEAQEKDLSKSNNISQKNGTSGNMSLNLSLNKTFTISSNVTARPMNGVGYDVSAENSKVQSPKKAVFVISGYTRPAIGATYRETSLLNAAYLSRGVEGTPHGYVTYYN